MEERLYPRMKENVRDTERIQEAVERVSLAGGGKVILSAGTYVSGTLRLKDHVTLFLEEGALLLGSDRIEDYPDNETCFEDAVGHKRGKALLYAYKSSDVSIEGRGTICGRGECFPVDHPSHLYRPFLVRFAGCDRVKIKNVSLCQSAAWCLHLLDCRLVKIQGVEIVNRCNENNDGIDVDGCQSVVISDCRIDSGDDALCLKATSSQSCRDIQIRNCAVTSNWAAFKIGTESVGDFENIEVRDCTFFDVNGCAIKIVPVDGGNVNGVRIKNIRMLRCTGPVFISAGTRLRQYFSAKKSRPGMIRNVKIQGVAADVISARGGWYQGAAWGDAKGGIVLSGLKEYPLQDIEVSGCCFDMPGGFSQIPNGPVPEMGDRYPEFHLFDPLPACGIYVRHGKNIRLKENIITLKQPDVRERIVSEDAEIFLDEGKEKYSEQTGQT